MRHLRGALHVRAGGGCAVAVPHAELNDDLDAGGRPRRIDRPGDRDIGAPAAAAGEDAAHRKNAGYHTAGESLRCHAHVQVGRAGSAGGNMWKYIATTIGMNTRVL